MTPKRAVSPGRAVLMGSVLAMLAGASLALAAPRGGGHFSPGAMRPGPGINRPGIVSRPGMMYRPGSATWNGQRWSGNWRGRNWNGRNWNGWRGDWRFHHRHFNKIVFIGDFGFPWWWGWGWGPWWWDWGYPYYYPYYYPYGGYPYYGYYGYGYGYYGDDPPYQSPTRSKVAELQRRLARAGYYRGAIDGILGPQTRRAIRAYERDHGYG